MLRDNLNSPAARAIPSLFHQPELTLFSASLPTLTPLTNPLSLVRFGCGYRLPILERGNLPHPLCFCPIKIFQFGAMCVFLETLEILCGAKFGVFP